MSYYYRGYSLRVVTSWYLTLNSGDSHNFFGLRPPRQLWRTAWTGNAVQVQMRKAGPWAPLSLNALDTLLTLLPALNRRGMDKMTPMISFATSALPWPYTTTEQKGFLSVTKFVARVILLSYCLKVSKEGSLIVTNRLNWCAGMHHRNVSQQSINWRAAVLSGPFIIQIGAINGVFCMGQSVHRRMVPLTDDLRWPGKPGRIGKWFPWSSKASFRRRDPLNIFQIEEKFTSPIVRPRTLSRAVWDSVSSWPTKLPRGKS